MVDAALNTHADSFGGQTAVGHQAVRDGRRQDNQYNGEWESQTRGHRELLPAANIEKLRPGARRRGVPPTQGPWRLSILWGRGWKDGGGRCGGRGRESQA